MTTFCRSQLSNELFRFFFLQQIKTNKLSTLKNLKVKAENKSFLKKKQKIEVVFVITSFTCIC